MKNPKIFDWEEKIVTDIDGVGEKREWIKHRGINLLDYFAGQALAGTMSQVSFEKEFNVVTFSKIMYSIAEAMLKERGKRNV